MQKCIRLIQLKNYNYLDFNILQKYNSNYLYLYIMNYEYFS